MMVLPVWMACDNASIIYPVKKDIVETVYASGKIAPASEHWLSAQSNGTILKKLVDDGDTVVKGQSLYIISGEVEHEDYNAALANYNMTSLNLSDHSPVLKDLELVMQTAEVKYREDSTNYCRWKELWENNIGTRSNLDNALSKYRISLNEMEAAEQRYHSMRNELKTSKQNAGSRLASARKALNDVYVRSDQDGIVYKALREAGESVTPNEKLVLLGDAAGRVIELNVDQQDIDRIRTGQHVLLQVDAKDSKIHEAIVSFISPVMNETDQTFRVEAQFKELPAQSFIYRSLEANIVVDTRKQALALPRTALASKDSVWVKKDGKQIKVPVKVGISTLDYIEILSGIDENTAVLVDYNAKK